MKQKVSLIILFLLFIVFSTAYGENSHLFGVYSPENMTVNGEYVISVFAADGWIEAGRLGYDRFFREKQLDLERYRSANTPLKLQIEKRAGGAAHIDSIMIGNTPPRTATGTDIAKLIHQDSDIADATNRPIIVEFPDSAEGEILSLVGRIEHTRLSGVPFVFPNPDRESPFYSVSLNPGETKPVFREWTRPGTGHPPGYTYAWARLIGDSLRITLDFTPDNTWDHGEDYAGVYIKTDTGVREYVISGERSQ